MDDANRISELLTRLERPVVLLIHTLGGPVLPVVQIAKAVQRHGEVAAFVPHHALSGGTFVSLAAKSIHLWPNAVLGPVDPQIGRFSASALLSVLQSKPVEAIDDFTLALAHEAKKAMAETLRLTKAFAGDDPLMLRRLVSGETTHSYPIDFDEARSLGLKVKTAAPEPKMRALVQALVVAESADPWEF